MDLIDQVGRGTSAAHWAWPKRRLVPVSKLVRKVMYVPSVGERVELINDLSGRSVGFGVLQSIDPDIADARFVVLKDGECRHRFYRSDQIAPCRMVAANSDLPVPARRFPTALK